MDLGELETVVRRMELRVARVERLALLAYDQLGDLYRAREEMEKAHLEPGELYQRPTYFSKPLTQFELEERASMEAAVALKEAQRGLRYAVRQDALTLAANIAELLLALQEARAEPEEKVA